MWYSVLYRSNIDTDDVIAAIHYHGLTPIKVFTSEDAKSYKPRAELFEMALKETNLNPQEIVHIGDSLNSDIKGAANLGINTIWMNRNNKEIPDGVVAVVSFTDILNTPFFSAVKNWFYSKILKEMSNKKGCHIWLEKQWKTIYKVAERFPGIWRYSCSRFW